MVQYFNKFIQLLAYADDTDITARSQPSLKEAFLSEEGESRRMGLRKCKINNYTSEGKAVCKYSHW
jgi:hypothetical protein